MTRIGTYLAMTAAVALGSFHAHAAGDGQAEKPAVEQQAGTREGTAPAVQPQVGLDRAKWDVEELNDVLPQMRGRTVTVVGEVEEELHERAFMLESGGLFDDEIIVLVPPQAKRAGVVIQDDEKLEVVGTVRAVRVVDIERDYGWDLDPELEAELEGVRHYLVADRIVRAD